MYEVRLHGRGGQGAVMAAGMLAAGLVAEGKFAVAIPSFGFERRGAPVVAFLRTDPHEIRRMTNITHPDCVICIDPTVSRSVNIFAGSFNGKCRINAFKNKINAGISGKTDFQCSINIPAITCRIMGASAPVTDNHFDTSSFLKLSIFQNTFQRPLNLPVVMHSDFPGASIKSTTASATGLPL